MTTNQELFESAVRYDPNTGCYVDYTSGLPVTPERFEESHAIGGPLGTTDADVFAAYVDYNIDVDSTERYNTYADYVQGQVANYEHLLRTDGANPEWTESVQYWLTKVQAEDNRLRPLCGACGYFHPRDDCDLMYEAIHVTIDLTVLVKPNEDPEDIVRQHLIGDAIWERRVTVDDVFRDEPDN